MPLADQRARCVRVRAREKGILGTARELDPIARTSLATRRREGGSIARRSVVAAEIKNVKLELGAVEAARCIVVASKTCDVAEIRLGALA